MRELAERNGVPLVTSDVIYELMDNVKVAMLQNAPAEIKRIELGTAKILALFKEDHGKQVVGGRVESGTVRAGARFDTQRNGVVIGSGRIIELQSQKKSMEEVPAGQEFGILASAEPLLAVSPVDEEAGYRPYGMLVDRLEYPRPGECGIVFAGRDGAPADGCIARVSQYARRFSGPVWARSSVSKRTEVGTEVTLR